MTTTIALQIYERKIKELEKLRDDIIESKKGSDDNYKDVNERFDKWITDNNYKDILQDELKNILEKE